MLWFLKVLLKDVKLFIDSFIGKFFILALKLCHICLSQSCSALEALSDESLSDTTGEGIALLPQDAYMVFRAPGNSEPVADVLSDRTKDTGYIIIFPLDHYQLKPKQQVQEKLIFICMD